MENTDILKEYGYIKVEQEKGGDGGFGRNIYTLTDVVPCPNSSDTAPCPNSSDTVIWDTKISDTNINSIKSNNTNINRGSEGTPALTEKVYGEFMQVRMSDSDYAKLTEKHGKEKTEDYIAQLDEAFASGRTQHRPKENHRAIIEGLIRREGKQPPVEPRSTPTRRRFNNFKGRQRDYAELERLEREYLRERVAAMAPNDGEPGPRATP